MKDKKIKNIKNFEKKEGQKTDHQSSQELPEEFLDELEKLLTKTSCPECLMCGWCCKQTICYYGEWDYEKNQCKFLTENNLCSKYDEINKLEDEMKLEIRLFGSGCCLNFTNPERLKKLKESSNKEII